jgi:AcrR family transcriptional regulator
MGFPFVLSTPIYRSIDIFAGEMNMATPTGKAGEILDSAERQARRRGYNGFSFRDLAADVGIKSASVHYHFPTKAELGAAVAQRYTERFMAHLGDPADPEVAPDALLERYVAAFRRALVRDRQMCLCGLLGAEVESLPPRQRTCRGTRARDPGLARRGLGCRSNPETRCGLRPDRGNRNVVCRARRVRPIGRKDSSIASSPGLARRAMLAVCALAEQLPRGGAAFEMAGRRWRDVSKSLSGFSLRSLSALDRRRSGPPLSSTGTASASVWQGC